MPNELCLCSLSGDWRVVVDGKACEICRAEERLPFTSENVERAFVNYQKRIALLLPHVEDIL